MKKLVNTIYIYIYLIVQGSGSSSLIWRKICMVFIMEPKRFILLQEINAPWN